MKSLKNKMALFLSLFVLTSCVSKSKISTKNIDSSLIDQVSLGQTKETVQSTLGPAQKIYHLKTNGIIKENLWIYMDTTNNSQRSAISFDDSTHLLVLKTLIPKENETESNLDYVLKTKFKNIKFEKLSSKRCSDFISSDIIYYSSDNGISIKYSSRFKTVESINWTLPAKLKEEISNLQTCEKNTAELIEIK